MVYHSSLHILKVQLLAFSTTSRAFFSGITTLPGYDSKSPKPVGQHKVAAQVGRGRNFLHSRPYSLPLGRLLGRSLPWSI